MRRAIPSLKSQALALLARREHSRQELRTKLLAHAYKLAQQETSAAPHDEAEPNPHAAAAADLGADSGAIFSTSRQARELAAAWQPPIEALLDELAAAGYLSDERFAETRVNARAAGHGQARIRQELARHGVELPELLAESLRDSELERAKALCLRRFSGPAVDRREHARRMRFLAARGFSAEIVHKVTAAWEDEEGA